MVRHGLRERAELRLARGQRGLRRLPLGDVDECADRAGQHPIEDDGFGTVLHRKGGAVDAEEELVQHVRRDARRCRAVDRAIFAIVVAAVRVRVMDEAVERAPDHRLAVLEAEHLEERGIAESGKSVAIDGIERLGCRIEHLRRGGFCREQRMLGDDPFSDVVAADEDADDGSFVIANGLVDEVDELGPASRRPELWGEPARRTSRRWRRPDRAVRRSPVRRVPGRPPEPLAR